MAKLNKLMIERMLFSLDWTGHFELPDQDIRWIAEQLAAILSGEGGRCEACSDLKEIIVDTPLGQMCEDCIKVALRDAREAREGLEED